MFLRVVGLDIYDTSFGCLFDLVKYAADFVVLGSNVEQLEREGKISKEPAKLYVSSLWPRNIRPFLEREGLLD